MSMFDRISQVIPTPILHKIDRTLQRVIYHSGAAQPFQELLGRIEQLERAEPRDGNEPRRDVALMLDYFEMRIDNIYANLMATPAFGQAASPVSAVAAAALGAREAEVAKPLTPPRATTLSGHEPAMSIEEVTDPQALRQLFNHIQMTWQHLGETDPFWSVIAAPRFHLENLIESVKQDFYDSGRGDVDRMFATLARSGIDAGHFRSCLEYGCGLGRVTCWLASHFDHVHAYDISRAHLHSADEYLRARGLSNIELHQLRTVEELFELPRVDLVFSVIVLQHNPPPIIEMIIRQLLRSLNPNGMAFFQVPTYRRDYHFSLKKYLGDEATRSEMEMHVLPQRAIFQIVRDENAELVEILQDRCTGMQAGEVSNTFLIRKR